MHGLACLCKHMLRKTAAPLWQPRRTSQPQLSSLRHRLLFLHQYIDLPTWHCKGPSTQVVQMHASKSAAVFKVYLVWQNRHIILLTWRTPRTIPLYGCKLHRPLVHNHRRAWVDQTCLHSSSIALRMPCLDSMLRSPDTCCFCGAC